MLLVLLGSAALVPPWEEIAQLGYDKHFDRASASLIYASPQDRSVRKVLSVYFSNTAGVLLPAQSAERTDSMSQKCSKSTLSVLFEHFRWAAVASECRAHGWHALKVLSVYFSRL